MKKKKRRQAIELQSEKSEDFLTASFSKKAGISGEKSEDKKARKKSDF